MVDILFVVCCAACGREKKEKKSRDCRGVFAGAVLYVGATKEPSLFLAT